MHIRGLRLLSLAALVAVSGQMQGETKADTEVFEKWIEWQQVFKDCSLREMCAIKSKRFWNRFKQNIVKYQTTLQPLKPFFATIHEKQPGMSMDDAGSIYNKQELEKFYASLDNNMLYTLDYFKNHNFLNESVNQADQDAHIDDTISKYKRVLKVLLSPPSKEAKQQSTFAFANRMFEASYGPENFSSFYTMLNDEKLHQIMRFCYSTMWFYLVGEGWKHWHENCLQRVKRDADKGKEIVYIAGGNDIYQLVKRGIYNIRVIDPMLPSQPDYYSEGWDWLLQSGSKNKGLGDRLTITADHNQKLVMKRQKYQESGSFQARLSTDQEVTLPLSTTTWGVFNEAESERLGTIVFERRFCGQDDFTSNPKKSLLISFNEMYFVAMPSDYHGWGIDLNKIPSSLTLHVKQLRKPVTKRVLMNLRKGEDTDFTFIMLGSCAT